MSERHGNYNPWSTFLTPPESPPPQLQQLPDGMKWVALAMKAPQNLEKRPTSDSKETETPTAT